MTENAEKDSGSSWPWIAALWLTAIAVFWVALFCGKAFYFRDTLVYYYPEAKMTSSAWLSGQMPLWDPKISMGYPYHCDPHSMIFYPLTVLFLLLPFPIAYNVFNVIHVPLLGTFMFMLLRRWGFSRAAATMGGAVLMLCGFTISCTSLTTLLRGLVWTPLALWAFDGFLQRGGWRPILATALVLAVEGSGTDPNYVLYTGGLLALLPWIRPRQAGPGAVKHLAAVVAAGGFALILLAYQYLPLAELISRSDRPKIRASELAIFYIHPVNLYNLFLPTPFPDPQSPDFFASFHDGELPFYPELYYGFPVLVFVVAAFGWTVRRRPEEEEEGGQPELSCRRPVLVLAALALFTLCVCLGDKVGVFNAMLRAIPPLKLFRYPAKYFLITAFAIAALAGYGFEGVWRGRESCCRAYVRALVGSLVLLTFCMAGVRLAGQRFPRIFLNHGGKDIKGDPRPFLELISSTWMSNMGSILGVLIATWVVVMLWRRLGVSRSLCLVLAGALAVTDLGLTTGRGIMVADNATVLTPPASATAMGPVVDDAPPVRFVNYPLNDLAFGFEMTDFDYVKLSCEMLEGMGGPEYRRDTMLSLLSVRTTLENTLGIIMLYAADRAERDLYAAKCGSSFAVSPEGRGNVPGKGRIVSDQLGVVVRKLEGVSPRIFIAPRAVPLSQATTREASAAILVLPDEARFEAEPPVEAPASVIVPNRIKECRYEHFKLNSVEVAFDLEGDGLLVMLEKYHPGWKAWVDGRERRILRVAGVFRGVEVHQGEKKLVMVYDPLPFKAGAWLSGLFLALVLGILASGRREPAA